MREEADSERTQMLQMEHGETVGAGGGRVLARFDGESGGESGGGEQWRERVREDTIRKNAEQCLKRGKPWRRVPRYA